MPAETSKKDAGFFYFRGHETTKHRRERSQVETDTKSDPEPCQPETDTVSQSWWPHNVR